MRNGSSFTSNLTGKRRVSLRLLVILGGVTVSLLLVEVTLRIIGFRYLNLSREDQYVGYALRPGAEGWWTKEGETYIKINSDGLRDREHSIVKPPETLRIAILGDSYAEALQGCKAFGGRRVEVINFGISGFSTARELITLRQRVWQYSPDIVLLVVTTSNDIKDNSRLLSQEYADLPLPYFVYKNGELLLDDSLLKARNESLIFRLQKSFLGGLLNWLRDHSRLIGLLDKARAAFQNYRQRGNSVPTVVGDEHGIKAQVYREPTDPAWVEAWRVTEGLMLLMRDEVRAHGSKFLIVTGSTGIQVYPDPKVRQDFMRRLGVNDLFYPDRRIKALGEREGIEVLNLAPALQEYADQSGAFLHGKDGFGHWNVVGHRVAGEQIIEQLCEVAATNR
jgi:hypothetical protein